MPKLIVKKQRKEIFDFPISNDITTIGRSNLNDLCLPDSQRWVSRYHAAIVKIPTGDGYFLRDLGSLNGTRVGGKIVFRKLLQDGDVISIGNYDLTYSEAECYGSDSRFSCIRYRTNGKEYNEYESPIINGLSTVEYEDQTVYFKKPDILPNISSKYMAEVLLSISNQISRRGINSMEDLTALLEQVFSALDLSRIFVVSVDDEQVDVKVLVGNEPLNRSFPIPYRWAERMLMTDMHGYNLLFAALKVKGVSNAKYYVCLEKQCEELFNDDEKAFIDYVLERLVVNLSSGEDEEPEEIFDWPKGPIGNSIVMKSIRSKIPIIASSDVNVLIFGETGVGKEEIAKAISTSGDKKGGKFSWIDCNVLSKGLIESELFGHEKWAFTDAKELKIGLIETCNGGTILIDEVGDLSLDVQSKLLRFIETKKFRRVGGVEELTSNVRLMFATNKDLSKLVEAGDFRKDLYYRLAPQEIYIPPLRERREDIPLLIYFFLDKFAKEKSKKVVNISHEAMRLLWERYSWPGNVRELRNYMEVIVDSLPRDRKTIFLSDIPKKIRDQVFEAESNESLNVERGPSLKPLKDIEKDYIETVLMKTSGNVTKAAKILGISKPALYDKIRKYEITRYPKKET